MADTGYRERPSVVDGVTVWSRDATPAGAAVRILPDGCLDLIWVGNGLVVAGPDTTARLVTPPAGTSYTGLRFAPGVGPEVLGVPASDLVDAQPRLDEVWPAGRARRLAVTVEAAQESEAGLETALVRELAARGGGGPAAQATMARVARALGRGGSVAAVADEAGFSRRQLQRRSLAAFGYGPKHLARILRLQRALAAACPEASLARVAADCGYADQAHLAREARDLGGLPLGRLLGRTAPGQSSGSAA